MLFAELAATSAAIASTSARGGKTAQLATLLRTLGDDEVRPAVSWLTGELTQRQIGVGWASLRELPAPADSPSWSIGDIEAAFDVIKATTGDGSQARRRALIDDLFARSTTVEQDFLRGLLSGGLRQGALAGVMTDAVAKASGVPLTLVRRAVMLRGDLPAVAAAALDGGAAELEAFRLEVGRPIGPMLAQTAASPAEALLKLGGLARFEWKLDGARVQIHRDGDDVAVFTRSLDDITARVPEIVAAARALPVRSLVADGEALTVRADGRPSAFQDTAARFGSEPAADARVELRAYLFDILHLDGVDLIDAPGEQRWRALDDIVPPEQRIGALTTEDPQTAQAFLDETIARGHEGVVAKSLTGAYEAGRRGAGWMKIKPVHTLDLVVLAVEWGSGRRKGWLSNIHLGARFDDGDGFVMLGKTFKGMTDAMLAWQTERFTELADGPTDGYVVRLRPEQVVEIAFDGVQRSTRYPGGVALRFARVLRYRDDKRPDEADTLATVRGYLPIRLPNPTPFGSIPPVRRDTVERWISWARRSCRPSSSSSSCSSNSSSRRSSRSWSARPTAGRGGCCETRPVVRF